MSSRALKDRMMYGFDDDSVDAFSFLFFLFSGIEILVLVFGRWEDKTMGSSAAHATSRLALEFGICDFLFPVLLFVSSASDMACEFMGRTGAARCDLSFLASFFRSIYFLLSSCDLVTVRRQTGLAVSYYLDGT
jgi:hypothetical protein